MNFIGIWNCEGHLLDRSFLTNGITNSWMNSKYLKSEILIKIWICKTNSLRDPTYDIGRVSLRNIYFTVFAYVIVVLVNLFGYTKDS
jgi:hypothetical protein